MIIVHFCCTIALVDRFIYNNQEWSKDYPEFSSGLNICITTVNRKWQVLVTRNPKTISIVTMTLGIARKKRTDNIGMIIPDMMFSHNVGQLLNKKHARESNN